MNWLASSSLRSTSSSSPASSARLTCSHSARLSSERRRYSSTSIRYRADLVVVGQEPGHVLGAVLGGLGREVPEPLEELDADAPTEALGVRLHDRPEPRVQVLAGLAVTEHVDEALVIEPRRPELDPFLRHPDRAREERVGVPDAVAHADDVRRRQSRPAPDAPGHHRHRVRVVEQEPVGATLDHLVGHLDHDGDRAEAAHDPADADRVADRLAQPVLPRHVEVGPRRRVAADLDLVDQVVGAVERRCPRLVGRHVVPGVRSLDELPCREERVRETLVVDVVEGDLERSVQLVVRAQVREDAPRELDAARADDRDLRHGRESRTHRAPRRPRRVTLPRDRVRGGEPVDRQAVRGRTVGPRGHPPPDRVRADRGWQGLQRGARRAQPRRRRAGRRDPSGTRREMARGDAAGRGDRRRVRLGSRREPILAVGRRPRSGNPHRVLRARSGHAGGGVARVRGRREPPVPARELAHDLGVDATRAARGRVPRPGRRGPSGRDAGRARRGGEACVSLWRRDRRS